MLFRNAPVDMCPTFAVSKTVPDMSMSCASLNQVDYNGNWCKCLWFHIAECMRLVPDVQAFIGISIHVEPSAAMEIGSHIHIQQHAKDISGLKRSQQHVSR